MCPPKADHHAASYPKWILTAMINQLPAEAVGWRSPLGSCRPITLYKSFKQSTKTILSQKHTFKKLDRSFPRPHDDTLRCAVHAQGLL